MSFVSVDGDPQRWFRRALVIGSIVLAALLARAPAASASPILSITPSSNSVVVGDLFTVDFSIDDFTDLFAYQFSVFYDSPILGIVSITEGSLLASAGGTSPTVFNDSPGSFSFANALSGFGPGSNGGGSLLTVQFKVLAFGVPGGKGGSATIGWAWDSAAGDGLYDSTLQTPVLPKGTGALVSISQPPVSVPEPATLFSFALGAALWGAVRQRRRRSTSA